MYYKKKKKQQKKHRGKCPKPVLPEPMRGGFHAADSAEMTRYTNASRHVAAETNDRSPCSDERPLSASRTSTCAGFVHWVRRLAENRVGA